MNPEHPESGHAILDGPVHTRDLIDDATGECPTEVIEKSSACCGVRHPNMMPETPCSDSPPPAPAGYTAAEHALAAALAAVSLDASVATMGE